MQNGIANVSKYNCGEELWTEVCIDRDIDPENTANTISYDGNDRERQGDRQVSS